MIRNSLANRIYKTRIQRHAIWGRLSHNQICAAYAEHLLLENDKTLLRLYNVEKEFLGNHPVHGSLAKEGADGSYIVAKLHH